MFDDAVPFGIHFCRPRLWTTLMDKPDQGEEKYCKIWINPRGDTLLDEDDEIIVIAEDDNSYQIGELNMVDPLDVPEFDDPDKGKTVNILLVGFRRDLDDMINEIDKWVPKGSTLTSFARQDPEERMQILLDGGLETSFTNITFTNIQGNPVVMRDLEVKCEIPKFDAIIVLTESVDDDGEPLIPMNCDSRTLVTTLLIRDIQKKHNCVNTLVCEILDHRTENLLNLARLDDFLSCNDLVSMALGQVAKEPDIHGLLEDVFSPEGSEMHIKDIRYYAKEGETLNWWEMTARARMRGEVAMGFIKPELSKDPILNPGNAEQAKIMNRALITSVAVENRPDAKYTKKTRLTWKYGDKLVVFSED
jgi:hypothetical protein